MLVQRHDDLTAKQIYEDEAAFASGETSNVPSWNIEAHDVLSELDARFNDREEVLIYLTALDYSPTECARVLRELAEEMG